VSQFNDNTLSGHVRWYVVIILIFFMFLELVGTWGAWQNVGYQHFSTKMPNEWSTNVQPSSWRSVRRVGGAKKFVCKRCGRGYMWSSALKRHTNLECNKEPSYQCPYCPLRTRQLCSMKRHLKNKHVSVVPMLSIESEAATKHEATSLQWTSEWEPCTRRIVLKAEAWVFKLCS
jgi:hypothetical protein